MEKNHKNGNGMGPQPPDIVAQSQNWSLPTTTSLPSVPRKEYKSTCPNYGMPFTLNRNKEVAVTMATDGCSACMAVALFHRLQDSCFLQKMKASPKCHSIAVSTGGNYCIAIAVCISLNYQILLNLTGETLLSYT